MKPIIATLLFLISSMSFASPNILGNYEGQTSNNKKCSLEISKVRYGSHENSVEIEMNIRFEEKLFKKKKYQFFQNIMDFNTDISRGYISASNIEENPWTDSYNIEELDLKLNSKGSIEELSIQIEDVRWYRGKVSEQEICSNIVRK